MATETDQYKIDVNDAVAALQRLARAADDVKAQSENASSNMAKGAFLAEVAYNALAKAVTFVKDQLLDTVAKAADSEKIWVQQARIAGVNSEALKAQAAVMRDTLGVSDEMVGKMQTILLVHGAMPSQIEATTRATLNWAAATGVDANEALNTLMHGVEQGGQRLHALGIRYKSTGEFTADLTRATAALNEQFAGAAQAQAETFAGRMDKLKEQIDELKESIGGFFIRIEENYHVIGALTEAFKALRRSTGEDVDDDKAYKLLQQQLDLTNKLKAKTQEIEDLQGKIAFEDMTGVRALTSKEEEQEKLNRLMRESVGLADQLQGVEKQMAGPVGAGRKHAVGSGKPAADHDHDRDALIKDQEDIADTLARVKERDEDAAAKQLIRDRERESDITFKYKLKEIEIEKEAALKKEEIQKKAAEKREAIEKEANDQLMSYAKQGASFAIGEIGDVIMANTEYNRKLQEQAIARGKITDYEGHVLRDHAAAQAQLQKEAEAATQKRTADVLMGIAKEAAVRAIFSGAQAIASYAGGDIPSAEAYAIAAAEFAGVAAAAGGGAAIINANRGMTSDEKANLQAADKAENDRTKNEAKASSASAGESVLVDQKVYYLGIGAMSDIQQAAELDRIKQKRDQLLTGG